MSQLEFKLLADMLCANGNFTSVPIGDWRQFPPYAISALNYLVSDAKSRCSSNSEEGIIEFSRHSVNKIPDAETDTIIYGFKNNGVDVFKLKQSQINVEADNIIVIQLYKQEPDCVICLTSRGLLRSDYFECKCKYSICDICWGKMLLERKVSCVMCRKSKINPMYDFERSDYAIPVLPNLPPSFFQSVEVASYDLVEIVNENLDDQVERIRRRRFYEYMNQHTSYIYISILLLTITVPIVAIIIKGDPRPVDILYSVFILLELMHLFVLQLIFKCTSRMRRIITFIVVLTMLGINLLYIALFNLELPLIVLVCTHEILNFCLVFVRLY